MKKLIETLKNCWRVEDLRQRLLITLLFTAIYRFGSFVVLPGIDPAKQPQIEATLKKQLKQVSFVKGFAMPHKRYKVKKNRLQMIKQSWV